MLRESLTTSDEKTLSLNALEVNTKNKGLYNFVYDLAMEAQSMSKIKQDNKLNEAILHELSEVSKMMTKKREELMEYENRLREYERELNEREANMKKQLQIEYNRLMKALEENHKN